MMSRRAFLKGTAAIPAVALLPPAEATTVVEVEKPISTLADGRLLWLFEDGFWAFDTERSVWSRLDGGA